MHTSPIAPILKWMGGKRQLLPEIRKFLPADFPDLRYYEPFLGGGAVLFSLQPRNAVVNDYNAALMNVYRVIKDFPNELILALKEHKNEKSYYYSIRELDRNGGLERLDNIQQAARILYLNKTCYNGMFRVNNSGQFNVPFGNYKNPRIVNEKGIKAISNYFNKNNITLKTGDYRKALSRIGTQSFVYIDPPYYPLSETSSFTGYIEGGWSKQQQEELKDFCDKLDSKGIRFLLSNSSTAFITNLYRDYNTRTVQATRMVNSKVNGRGLVDEVLICNYDINML